MTGIPHCFVFSRTGELVHHGHPMEPDFEKVAIPSSSPLFERFNKAIQVECSKEAAFSGAGHSLGEKKEAAASEGIPSSVTVDEAAKKVKIAVRTNKGESFQFVRTTKTERNCDFLLFF